MVDYKTYCDLQAKAEWEGGWLAFFFEYGVGKEQLGRKLKHLMPFIKRAQSAWDELETELGKLEPEEGCDE